MRRTSQGDMRPRPQGRTVPKLDTCKTRLGGQRAGHLARSLDATVQQHNVATTPGLGYKTYQHAFR
jgi:hypothetical protein